MNTRAGGKKQSATIKAKHGADYWAKIGAKGGAKSKNGGFGSDKIGADGMTGKQRAEIAGAKGGKVSRRGKAVRDKS